MRVIIDARSFNQGGYGAILLALFENLDFNKNEYAVIGDKNVLDKLELPCKIINSKSKPHSFFGYLNHNLAKVINDYDCYFTPNYIIPRGIKINTYLIIHDMLSVDKTRENHRRFTDSLKRHILKKSYNKATKLFTVSEFSKNRIIEYFGEHREITVLHQGISNQFKRIADSIKVNKKQNYVVYSGSLKNHKNLDTLIEALAINKWKYKLHILCQKQNFSYIDKVAFKELSKNKNIIIKTSLSMEEYIKEIKEAKVMVQPSEYEGSSLPLLEGLYCGTKVIASNIHTNIEAYNKDEVRFFAPSNVDELVNILNEKITPVKINEEKLQHFDNAILAKTIEKSFSATRVKDYVKKNFIFNVIYQILVVITPLITAPYAARVLGVANIGKFSFSLTIATYFIIFGYLGFQQYAQRAIAEQKKDREKQSEVFWQIIIIRLIPVSISLIVLFILYFLNVFGEYSSLILFLSILVAGTAFDINFYFHGKENFFLVMIANLIIRIGFIISIFAFVKTRYDLATYTILYALMVFGGYLSMWIALPLNLRRIKLKTINFKKHLKGSLALFLPVAAISIYAILDKTLIGVLVRGETYQKIGFITIIAKISDLENGYYYQTERIIKAILSIILAFSIVMSARNSIEYTSHKLGSVKKNTYKGFGFVFAAGVPLTIGAIIVSRLFVPLFFGEGYEKVTFLMMIYAPIILIVGLSNVIGMQYLIPIKKDRQYSIAVLSGFAINLIVSVILIPFLGSLGAIIGTLISEFTILFIEYMFVKNKFSLMIIFKMVYKYLIAGAVMGVTTFMMSYFVFEEIASLKNIYNLIFTCIVGIVTYYLTLLILKDQYIFITSKIIFIKIKHAFIYLSRDVLFRSKTATQLLNVPSLSSEVKSKNIDIINQNLEKENKQNGKRK